MSSFFFFFHSKVLLAQGFGRSGCYCSDLWQVIYYHSGAKLLLMHHTGRVLAKLVQGPSFNPVNKAHRKQNKLTTGTKNLALSSQGTKEEHSRVPDPFKGKPLSLKGPRGLPARPYLSESLPPPKGAIQLSPSGATELKEVNSSSVA